MGIAATHGSMMPEVPVYPPEGIRGAFFTVAGEMLTRLSLPDDPVGVFTLTLLSVVPGSAIHVRDQADTTTLHSSTASGSTVVIQLQAYSGGSSLNNLRIKVRKGSAPPYYQSWETLATAIVGSQSIYVSQIPEE